MSKYNVNLSSGFLISYDWLPALESLSAEDFQSLILALIKRQKDGEPLPEFSNPTVGIFAKMIEPTIKRRLDGQSGGSKSKGTTQDTTVDTTVGTTVGTTQGTTVGSKVKKSKVEESKVISNDITISASAQSEKKKRFVKPTVEEVRAYCQERGNTVDAETFVNFYESKGWMVGKNHMKDWKSAVRTWEQSRRGETKPQETFSSFETDDFFQAALDRSRRLMGE